MISVFNIDGELRFYYGDFSSIDLSVDWRFCTIPNRRIKSELLEVISKDLCSHKYNMRIF